jgi:hypothetical protein
VKSRLLAAHPRGTGNALVEFESLVSDPEGQVCARMINGAFRRGVNALGDIEAFVGSGTSASEKTMPPERAPDVVQEMDIPGNQAMLYRLLETITPSTSPRTRPAPEALTPRSCTDSAPTGSAGNYC